MSKETNANRANFAWKVEDEGLDYSILHYFGNISGEGLDDPEFVALWDQADGILTQLEAKLEEWRGLDEEEDA